MAQSVAVTKTSTTQPRDVTPTITHDGMNERAHSPPQGSLVPRRVAADMTADGDSLTWQYSRTEEDQINSNDVNQLMDSASHRGKTQSQKDVHVHVPARISKDDVTPAQEMVSNGDSHQKGYIINSNQTSCHCPDKPRTRPAPPAKLHYSPKKPLPRALPPKLPPKPPHLLQKRSPSSDAMPVGGNLVGGEVLVKETRSQSVVVGRSPQREHSPEGKQFKRPVPTPRKSLPNIYPDGLSLGTDIKNADQTLDMDHAHEEHSESAVALLKTFDSKPQSPREETQPEKTDHLNRSNLAPNLQDQERLDVGSSGEDTKSLKRKSANARHIKVRERAAIFEKLIEEETRNRDSQISEPRSRTCSRSEYSEGATKFIDSSDIIRKSHSRINSYVNVPDSTLFKRAPLEDDMISVSSISSDCVFDAPQSSVRVPAINSPFAGHPEGDDPSEISAKESDNLDDFLLGANPSAEPDSPNSTLELSPRRPRRSSSIPEGLEKSAVKSSTSDFAYTDVVIPDPSTSQDAVSPRSSLQVIRLSPQPPKSRDTSPVVEEKQTIESPSSDIPESPPTLMPKPIFGVNTYRNVTPLFNLPPKPAAVREKKKGLDARAIKTRPATLQEKSKSVESDIHQIRSATSPGPQEEDSNIRPVDKRSKQAAYQDSGSNFESVNQRQKPAPQERPSPKEKSTNVKMAGQQRRTPAPQIKGRSVDQQQTLGTPEEKSGSTETVGHCNTPVTPVDIKIDSVDVTCSDLNDLRHEETSHVKEGKEVISTDKSGKNTAVPPVSDTHSITDISEQRCQSELPTERADTIDMPPEHLQRAGRSKSHPGNYVVHLPDFIDPVSLRKRSQTVNAGSEVIGGSEDDETQHRDRMDQSQPSSTDQTQESETTDMLCNKARSQRFAVKRGTNRYSSTYSQKWQHESAPATLGSLVRQEAVTEPPKDVTSPSAVSNRLSQVSSVGSTISSLISNVSVDDDEDFSSSDDDDGYVNVPVPSSDASKDIPPLPLSTDYEEDADGTSQDENSRHVPEEDVEDNVAEEDIYSNLAACQSIRVDDYEDVQLPQGPQEEVIEDRTEEEEEEEEEHDQDAGPIEIEMQLMRRKSPHMYENENRRKVVEFHMPLFLKNSSSVESSPSVSHDNDRSEHSQTTLTEDSDSSGDFLDDNPSIPSLPDSDHKPASKRESYTSCEQSDDGCSAESSHRFSTESSNQIVHLEPRNYRRIRGKGSEYDRPVSSISMDYDRPISSTSADYDRPISSTSADYISVLDSFHEDGTKKEDGFSFTWTVNPNEEGSQQDETYRPKSEEVVHRNPSLYDAPRASTGSAPPAPSPRASYKALKPPKVPRPYSEPSRKFNRNSSSNAKNLPIPSKEEITEQLSKISRQRSRFVTQEPLFQLYQEDARSRDSYLRLMNISSLESLTTFLEKQEALKKAKRDSKTLPNPSNLPEYRTLVPEEEIYRYQSGEELKTEEKPQFPTGEDFEPEDIYTSAEPVYEPPGELFYETGNLLQNNAIYESGSLGSSTGEGSGGSGSDVEIPKPYGLMQRTVGSGAVRRSYWSELPEVVNSGLLEQMTPEEKRLQEALFEVITSEASYLRSLNLVVEHFSEAITLQPPTGLLNKVQHHRLFSNIRSVRDASEKLLLDLEERQQDNIIISDMCDILLQHFDKGGFNSYIVYCANNQYQIKTLEELKKNVSFVEVLKYLESSPACCCLDLQSFLMLPFQRITRLPLLLEAIRQQAKLESPLHKTAMDALKALRKMAEQCNEEAKRMELIEEVTQLANQLDFREGVKKMNLSQTTSIVKRGRIHVIKKENKLLNRGKLVAKTIHIIVFTDKVVICKEKMKGEQLKYEVHDWCPRNLVHIEPVNNPQAHNKLPDGVPGTCKHVFIMSFLQNNQKKEVEFALDANSEAEKERWMDAMHPAKRTQDGETIYESWDCPQVICKQPYEAQDRDEISLYVYDRMDIDKKIEGWYYGTRVGDNAKGWFPASYTQEIVNDHVLARNLKQRHRLLSLCDQHLRHGKNVKK